MVGAVAFACYLLLSLRHWQRYDVPSYDLGIFAQAIGALAQGRAPVAPYRGPDFIIFADHFHPVIALLTPFYLLAPTPVTLLVAQDALFAVSAAVVTRTAVVLLGRRDGVLLGLAYAGSWGLASAVVSQFHEVAFAVPLIAASLAALLRERWRSAALWAAPLVVVKEDLGLTVAVIGLLLAVRGRRAGYPSAGRLGAALAAWGFAWVALALGVVLPALHRGDGAFPRQSMIPWASLADPLEVVRLLTQPPVKLLTLLLLVVVTAGLCLRSPLVLAGVPTLLWRFFADHATFWGPFFHYNAVLMPVVFLAAVDVLAMMRREQARPYLGVLARLAVPFVGVVALLFAFVGPQRQLLTPGFYAPGPDSAAAAAVLAPVPRGAVVEDGSLLGVYLVGRAEVYDLDPTEGIGSVVPEYVLDLVDPSAAGASTRVRAAQDRHPGTRWEVVVARAPYVLLRRG